MMIFQISLRVFVVFACSFLFKAVVSDWFTAVVKLEHLIIVEEKMIYALERYVDASAEAKENVPGSVKTFLTDALEKNTQASEPHFIENPINAYHFVKRMADWNIVFSNINCDDCFETEAMKNLNQSISAIRRQSNIVPEAADTDIVGAAVALVRVWHTYRLDLGQLFRGKIFNTTAEPLTADDVYRICRILGDQQMYYKEIQWLEEFVRQVEDGYYTRKTSAQRAYKALAGAYDSYGMPWKSETLLLEYLKKDPDNQSIQRDLKNYAVKLKTIPADQRTLTLQLPEEEQKKEHYEALCRGDIKRPISLTSQLKCFLKPTLIPMLFGKEEVLNYDPRVSMFYDVITEGQMMFLKGRVMNKRSGIVGNLTKPGDEKSHTRVSQTAWLHDNIDPIIRKFTYRIQLFTGFSTELLPKLSHAEELQILNYGIGGMYEPHLDWFGFPLSQLVVRKRDPPMLIGTGDRIATWLTYGYPQQDLKQREQDPYMLLGTGDRLATWLTYLNSVEAGGATVFINLNITVPVVKGAAAFWYNIKRTGECDQRTWHAGCPVLIGSKWAANKWFREIGNIFRRKCGKTPDSLDKPIS